MAVIFPIEAIAVFTVMASSIFELNTVFASLTFAISICVRSCTNVSVGIEELTGVVMPTTTREGEVTNAIVANLISDVTPSAARHSKEIIAVDTGGLPDVVGVALLTNGAFGWVEGAPDSAVRDVCGWDEALLVGVVSR